MSYVALFTGQGSQFSGMGKELYEESPAARRVFDEADRVLPGLKDLCFSGSEDELVLTVNTQPCVLTVDVAAYRAFSRDPEVAAGHSLGEFAALVAAGSLALADALRLVRRRAQLMQEAVPPGRGGMVVLRNVDRAEAERIVESVKAGACDLANLNEPGQYVLSGAKEAMDEVVEMVGPRRALRLPVSVPFHSRLLADAGRIFARELDEVTIRDASFPIVCNVDAVPISDAGAVRDALKRQFAGSVRWQDSIERLLEEGARHFVEFGPKPVLARMVARIARARGVEVETKAVTGPNDLDGAG